MTHAQQIRTIHSAFDELGRLNLYDGFWEVRERLLDMNLAAERRHRKGAPDGVRHGIGVTDAAKLFTVSHLLDGWQEPDKWTLDAILHIRTEVLYAQAYAKKHHEELRAWAEKWIEPFEQVDWSRPGR